MSSTKKKEKKSSVLPIEIDHKLITLELAYNNLQQQFFALKDRLQTSHQTLEKIVNHMSEGLMFVTIGGKISLFNPAASEILGCNVVDEIYWDHFSDSLFGFSMREALQKPSFQRRIFLNINEEKEIEVSTSSIPEKGIILLISHRVEQEQVESGLNQAERLKELGVMAATLAHEIRNPLGGIEGFAQLLKRDLEEPTHQRMVGAILDGTQALNKLVADVLEYARPLNLHFEQVDLVALIKDVLNPVTCRFKHHKANHLLSLDRDHIQRVLLNLLRNAHEAGATHVDIELAEGYLTLKDNGEGISSKNLKKIFTPFFTTKAKGTGLGLAHSLAVIKAHGGTLEITSEVGRGTQITIKL